MKTTRSFPVVPSLLAFSVLSFAPRAAQQENATPLPPGSSSLIPSCLQGIRDQSSPGDCLAAASDPTFGTLYPLGVEFNIDPTGLVGMGTTVPGARLNVVNVDNINTILAQRFSMSGTTAAIRGETYSTSANAVGVLGVVTDTDAGSDSSGVRGETRSTSANAIGVHGVVTNTNPGIGSVAVDGENRGTGLFGIGVRGSHDGAGWGMHGTSEGGIGVRGEHRSTSGTAPGVLGLTRSESADAVGVQGIVDTVDAGTASAGVYGRNDGNFLSGYGVWGDHATLGWGVYGTSGGTAVRGESTNSTGVYGETNTGSYGVFSCGDFGGSGAKYFVQPHPKDPGKEIRFVSLEGNESGTYFRGSTHLRRGRAVIEVPEEFRLVSERKGLTVQLTPIGKRASLWIESKSLDRIIVRGDKDVEVDYFVNGVRRGFAKLEPIRENDAFVPLYYGEPYGQQYPEDLRRILVENGILNADFTPNEETAREQGWILRRRPVRSDEPLMEANSER